MGSLDLTSVDGLARLLGAHWLVQSLFEAELGEDAAFGFLPLLRADLRALGRPAPEWTAAPHVSNVDPLGYRYVVAGSQLGGRLLHRDWNQARDEAVRAAGRYLTANLRSRAWPDFLAETRERTFDPNEEARILRSANRVFEVYDAAATELGIGIGHN